MDNHSINNYKQGYYLGIENDQEGELTVKYYEVDFLNFKFILRQY